MTVLALLTKGIQTAMRHNTVWLLMALLLAISTGMAGLPWQDDVAKLQELSEAEANIPSELLLSVLAGGAVATAVNMIVLAFVYTLWARTASGRLDGAGGALAGGIPTMISAARTHLGIQIKVFFIAILAFIAATLVAVLVSMVLSAFSQKLAEFLSIILFSVALVTILVMALLTTMIGAIRAGFKLDASLQVIDKIIDRNRKPLIGLVLVSTVIQVALILVAGVIAPAGLAKTGLLGTLVDIIIATPGILLNLMVLAAIASMDDSFADIIIEDDEDTVSD